MILNILKSKGARTAFKIITVILTLGIIFMLVISGPAQAFSLTLNSDKQNIYAGETVTFNAVLNVNSNEYNQFNAVSFRLVLDGPEKKICTFNILGNKLSCDNAINITVQMTNSSQSSLMGLYGYLPGYGYGESKNIRYTITVNTNGYLSGNYNTSIEIISGQQTIKIPGSNLLINLINTQNNYRTYSYSRETENDNPTYNEISKTFSVSGGEKYTIVSDGLWHDLQIMEINGEYVKFKLDDNFEIVKLGELKEFNIGENGNIELGIWFIGSGKAKIHIDAQNLKILEKKTLVKNIPAKYTAPQSNNVNTADSNTQNTDNKINFLDLLNKIEVVIMLIFVNLIALELIGIVGVAKRRKTRRKMKRTVIKKY